MSQSSDKIHVIDQSTYKILKKDNGDSAQKIPRSAKYKNKHKEKQYTLFDFLIVPRKKQKEVNKRRRPHLIIARNSFAIQPKRKGKTRLRPKKRLTRVKRIIKCNRASKRRDAQEGDNKLGEPLEQSFVKESTSIDLEENCRVSVAHVLSEELQKCTFGTTDKEKPGVEINLSEPMTQLKSENLLNNEPKMLRVTADLMQLSLNEAHPIHSRRFRSYCDNCTTGRLKELTTQLLNDLIRFQKRAYAKNEIKARAHPRLVVGFREALSRLRINKVKLLLLATDCEICPGQGGLDETIDQLKSTCQQQKVPYCCSLLRRELAYALHKRAQISCVAILDYDGANDTYKQLLHELGEARVQYKHLTAA